MTSNNLGIKDILVAVDASPASLGALAIVAELAGILDANLAGLFIEDEDLLSAASLPFSTESRIHSASESPLERANIEQQMRLLSATAERALKAEAERWKVRWHFKHIRGNVLAELIGAAEKMDMISIGASGWGASLNLSLGRCAKTIVQKSGNGPFLLYPTAVKLGENIVAVISDLKNAERILAPAADYAIKNNYPLTVVFTKYHQSIESNNQRLTDILQGYRLPHEIFIVDQNIIENILQLIQRHPAKLVFIEINNPIFDELNACKLVEKFKAPAFLL